MHVLRPRDPAPCRRSPIRTSTALAVALLTAVGLVLGSQVPVAVADPPASSQRAGQPAVATKVDPPFVVPDPGTTRKKVFAHYFPPYPVSLDNKAPEQDYYSRHYLDPDGEKGKFATAGGLLRDRPVGRDPRSGDFRLGDLRTEVEQASAAGIDGFTVNLMSLSGRNWETSRSLFTAAERSGHDFTVVPNVDTNGSIGKASATQVADKLAALYDSPAAHRLDDGRYLLSSFKAEGRPVSWWKQVMDRLEDRHGVRVAFVAVLLAATQDNLEEYAPISYALSDWGTRNPDGIERRRNMVAVAKKLGSRWMAPVAFQDVRPAQYVYAESVNSKAMRMSWQEAMYDGADMVQLVTWNDYSEGTQFAVSESQGSALLELSAYWLARFKTGRYPAIQRDALYATHRVQPADADPRRNHRLMKPTLGKSTTAPRDYVEVVAFLTDDAKVTITSGKERGTFTSRPGFSVHRIDLATGKVAATANRGSRVAVQLRSPYQVESRQSVQTLNYHVAGS